MYARGILFGKMKYELGDHSFVRCPENNLTADMEFKTKGYFSGTYNAIGGSIKNEKTGEVLFELSGMWSGEMSIKNVKTGKKEVLFDATHARHTPPAVRPLEEQSNRESQKLWYKTVLAIKDQNHEVATDEKTKIEDMQREEAAQRQSKGVEWQPKLFRPVHGGPGGSEEGEEDLDFILNADINGATPEEKVKQILAITPILRNQKQVQQPEPSEKQPGQKELHQPLPSQQPQPQSQQARNPSTTSEPSMQHAPSPVPVPVPIAAPASGRQGDLIDFGNNAEPARPTLPPNTHFTEENISHPSLQEPLQPGQPIKRQDTNSGAVDEFVDADDGT
ncbi:hypothetical protein MMC18_004697 [Xylographa bjoerkii]|nr:hypothetical protein [Xylographa bjoerkii]